jgi:four helix bundle protein
VSSNIAEGLRRKSKADCLHFYTIALGSREELRYQLLIARDLSYITKGEHARAITLGVDVGKLINGWKKSQK